MVEGGASRAYTSPLLSWAEVSLSQPVYSMVTLSPTLGEGPDPSTVVVLVTPIVSARSGLRRGCEVVLEIAWRSLEARWIPNGLEGPLDDMDGESKGGCRSWELAARSSKKGGGEAGI